jgi:glycosyltransferase involved in cell wall biosynthesis
MNRALPKVSVITITYGHEKYITETLDGVLMQQYDGPVEFIIANDNSPDATDEVVKKYFLENPAPSNFEIKYTKHETNKGMMPNFIWALEQATGKYIALCEGDDYWTDPLKLQKQVDFLEESPDYVIHSGKAQILRKGILGEFIGNARKSYQLQDFYTKNNLITCTVMFRNKLVRSDTFSKLIFGDWKLYTVLLSETPASLAYTTDDLFAVYRIHEGGVMQTVASQFANAKAHLVQIETITNELRCNFSKRDTEIINTYCITIFRHYLSERNYKESIKVLMRNSALVGAKIPLRNYLGIVRYLIFSKQV